MFLVCYVFPVILTCVAYPPSTFLSTANAHHLHVPSPFVPLPGLLLDDSTANASNATSHTHTSSALSAVLRALPVRQLKKPRPPNTSVCRHVYLIASPPAPLWECTTSALSLYLEYRLAFRNSFCAPPHPPAGILTSDSRRVSTLNLKICITRSDPPLP